MKNECKGSGYGAGTGGGGMRRQLVTCPDCGRKVNRNKDGRLRVHANLKSGPAWGPRPNENCTCGATHDYVVNHEIECPARTKE